LRREISGACFGVSAVFRASESQVTRKAPGNVAAGTVFRARNTTSM
jgi:hypothetical protein